MASELIWQHLDTAGWEHVRVISDHPGWTVYDSILVRNHGGQILRGGYTLVVDKSWRTLEVRLMIESEPGSMQGIHLLSEGDGLWTDANEQPIPELNGCFDVDIQWSPLTNTLPVNRLQMQPNQTHDIRVVYISLPELSLHPVSQQYERRDEQTVRYTSTSRGERSLQIDAEGYVQDYPGIFSRTWPK